MGVYTDAATADAGTGFSLDYTQVKTNIHSFKSFIHSFILSASMLKKQRETLMRPGPSHQSHETRKHGPQAASTQLYLWWNLKQTDLLLTNKLVFCFWCLSFYSLNCRLRIYQYVSNLLILETWKPTFDNPSIGGMFVCSSWTESFSHLLESNLGPL